MPLSSLDAALFKAINSGLHVPLLDPLMVFVTNQNPIVFLALFVPFFVREGKHSIIILLLALASFGIADWTGGQLKDIFMRPRPCQTFDEVVLLVKCTGLSMPSNHAANSFAFALPFVIMSRGRLRWLFLAFAALVAYSRVYVGVHYPGDITVGAVLGSTIGFGISFAYLRFKGDRQMADTTDSKADENQSATP